MIISDGQYGLQSCFEDMLQLLSALVQNCLGFVTMAHSMYSSMEAAASVLRHNVKGKEVVAIVEEMLKRSREDPKIDFTDPVVVIEGLDGTGKTTVLSGLEEKMSCTRLSSPPVSLKSFREYFDQQAAHLRRAFYLLGNYACALQLRDSSSQAVIIDRFWPSTVAYGLARDLQAKYVSFPGALAMLRKT